MMRIKRFILSQACLILLFPLVIIASSSSPLSSLRKKFENVLLVINFNHPHYSNIEFLKKIYSPVFEHIVFYGEKPDPEVINADTQKGYIMSNMVEHALTQFPDFQAYLFLQDDAALNVWNYINLDLNKIWYAVVFNDGKYYNEKFYDIRDAQGRYTGLNWGGWSIPWGWTVANEAITHLGPQELATLHRNCGVGGIPMMMCEVFLIPQRFRQTMIRMCPAFKKVLGEISITTMLCGLDDLGNWERLNMFGGESVIDTQVLKNYPTNVHWIHPIKFSKEENRIAIAAIFEKMFLA